MKNDHVTDGETDQIYRGVSKLLNKFQSKIFFYFAALAKINLRLASVINFANADDDSSVLASVINFKDLFELSRFKFFFRLLMF